MTTTQTNQPVWKVNSSGTIHTYDVYMTSAIEVHRHMDFPGKWLLSGRGILGGIDKVLLRSNDLEEAKWEAIKRVHYSINHIKEKLDMIMNTTKG